MSKILLTVPQDDDTATQVVKVVFLTELLSTSVENGGIDTETSYPYTAKNGECKYSSSFIGARCSGYFKIQFVRFPYNVQADTKHAR